MEESRCSSRKRNPTPNYSAQEVADRMNELLPLKLNPSDAEQNPEFVSLLTLIGHHVVASGRSKESENSITQAETSLKQLKGRWLQHQIIHTELEEWLLEQQIAVNKSKDSDSAKFYKAVQECLTFAEIGDFLNCGTDPALEVNLFGLTLEDIDRANPYHKHESSIQQSLIPDVENKLRKKCENLVQFHAQEIHSDTDKFTFAKATQLPGVLENEARWLENEQNQLKKEKFSREKQFWLYYQSLMESLNTLEQMVMKHRLKSQTKNDKITSDWLIARCDAICLKVRVFELGILCDTYDAETVETLTKIRTQIASSTKSTQENLAQCTQVLTAYESVGMDFDNLAKEYATLLDQLENKKWALQELQQSMAKEI